MMKTTRLLVGIFCLCQMVVSVGCAAKQGWHRPLFSAGNCGLPHPVSSVVFEAPAGNVSSALEEAFRSRGWQPLQEHADHLEALYRRTVVELAAAAGPGPHHQYLLVIVTPVNDTVAKVSFVLSEFEPETGVGTSFALVTPEDFIDNYDKMLQSVRESLKETPGGKLCG